MVSFMVSLALRVDYLEKVARNCFSLLFAVACYDYVFSRIFVVPSFTVSYRKLSLLPMFLYIPGVIGDIVRYLFCSFR